jgi:hypothetical protein
VRDARRSAGGGDGAGVRAAGDAGDGSDVSATAAGSEGDASEDDDNRENVSADGGDCVGASGGTCGRRIDDGGGTVGSGDAEDSEGKVAITTATNINMPSREMKEIN